MSRSVDVVSQHQGEKAREANHVQLHMKIHCRVEVTSFPLLSTGIDAVICLLVSSDSTCRCPDMVSFVMVLAMVGSSFLYKSFSTCILRILKYLS